MQSVVKVGSDYYILASAVSVGQSTKTLADGETFAVFDANGDFVESPLGTCGLFHRDTRHLSRFEMRLGSKPAFFLNSHLSDDNLKLAINLTNSDVYKHDDSVVLPSGSVRIEREFILAGSVLYGRIRLRNFYQSVVRLSIKLLFAADFADLFEVRGVRRKLRGELLAPTTDGEGMRLGYRGRDGRNRSTQITFNPAPAELSEKCAHFPLAVEAGETTVLDVRICCTNQAHSSSADHGIADLEGALEARRAQLVSRRAAWARITTSHEQLNLLLKRSLADLTTMVSPGPDGIFMMAGIPWFATLFGRDSVVTALSVLPFNSEIAAGTLHMLAGLQGSRVDDTRDEQPGKIIHEMRLGEMAATGEVPFARYYGSVDATPLFLVLLASYVGATGDLEMAERLWPAAERALAWIRQWGDHDGDGYVEYYRKTAHGLANQGWKDSFDAISHADGELARAPIALAEVQAYVFAAYTGIAGVAMQMGRVDTAAELTARASALKQAFQRDFWMDDHRTLALALDCDKRPCRVVASNAGHCLAEGLLDGDRAAAAAKRLLADDMFSGWGIRTLSANERRYNPLSYHNGSVWPHDNAIAVAGLARTRCDSGVHQILDAMVQAASQLGSGSLPELFCGLEREPERGPVPYPVACHPQAWSAASVFSILSSMLELRIAGFDRRVKVDSPSLPDWLDWVRIDGLNVGGESISLRFEHTHHAVGIEVIEKRGRYIGVDFTS